MRRVTWLSLLLLLMLTLAACGGGGDTGGSQAPADEAAPSESAGEEAADEAPAAEDVTVLGLDTLKYEPAELTAAAGQTLNITLDNEGVLEHNITWEEGDVLLVAAPPSESATASYTFDEAGTYNFYCSVLGHKEAGMVGSVTVQ